MSLFDTYIAVDWSGGNDRGAKPKRDAIWACAAGEEPVYLRNRQVAEDWLAARLEAEAGRRVCVGFDFPFGYPAGFAEHLTGREDALALWDWFEAHIVDAPEVNNRFDIAGEINARVSGVGPFWFNGLKRRLPRKASRGNARQGKLYLLANGRSGIGRLSGYDGIAGAGAIAPQVRREGLAL